MKRNVKSRKIWVIVLAALGIVAMGCLIYFYSDIEALIRHYFLKEDVVLSNGQVLEAGDSGLPAQDAEQINGLMGVGDTCISDCTSSRQGIRQHTMNKVTVYDSIEASPVSIDECSEQPTLEETLLTYKFVVVDMTVKNLNEEKIEPFDEDELFPFIFDLIVRDNYEGISEDSEIMKVGSYMWYFSEHPKLDNVNLEEQLYCYYDLAPGESMDYQIGIAVPEEALEKKTTYLEVSDDDDENLKGFNLFQ